jgi:hypothetical protein
MFEVIEKKTDFVVKNFFTDEIIYSVWADEELIKLLKIGQIFLLRLSEFREVWLIRFMSPPYN